MRHARGVVVIIQALPGAAPDAKCRWRGGWEVSPDQPLPLGALVQRGVAFPVVVGRRHCARHEAGRQHARGLAGVDGLDAQYRLQGAFVS